MSHIFHLRITDPAALLKRERILEAIAALLTDEGYTVEEMPTVQSIREATLGNTGRFSQQYPYGDPNAQRIQGDWEAIAAKATHVKETDTTPIPPREPPVVPPGVSVSSSVRAGMAKAPHGIDQAGWDKATFQDRRDVLDMMATGNFGSVK